ncbi:hypothetical protein TWF225_006965 [Orbilia oligospora]|uniref:Uncharacterized protein n=1 Tax=Orbilia oligospora TaxID=2813651 RepID=A0A7C8PVY5_ORBOL|nr:hypothetical protein TWF751_008298 [Orbilia oligospora]KAF3194422.1 hypothetical protein TWF225_006965 [Orbilia oligospora]KAF3242713.1 hypothetical protein TWF128_010448 [Orbilia oligospora]KAF3264173.1 hypothetical protein TWF217_003325 [Orbilia oligospora]KAF3296075.1 hypothetical protein TWF132_011544 [Orbilia oligospora]
MPLTPLKAAFILALHAASSFASPVPHPKPNPLSIPGSLIPDISRIIQVPGFNELLSTLAPPLPILRVPTPPVKSPPFTASSLKPKKLGYFWTGPGNIAYADFLAVYSLDDDTFGTFITLVDVPTSGNEPHHLNVAKDGKTLVGTGLLSLLKLQDVEYFFDISNPYRPKFRNSGRAVLSSIGDEIVAKPDGGFFITHMGSAGGTNLGRLTEWNAQGKLVGEFPHALDIPGTLNILKDQFSPHGLSIDFDKNIILTSDFVVPLSTLKPSLGIQKADTLRLWTLSSRTIISTITIPGGGGIQDVKFIPGNKDSAAIATAVDLGQVWIIYPFKKNADGTQGVAELLYDLGPRAKGVVAIYSDFSANGRFLYLSLTTANHIAVLDLKDLKNPVRLDNPNEQQPVIGVHSLRVTPDQKNLVALGYFVRQGDIGLINTPADYKVHYVDILPNGALSFNRTIPFETEFANRGGGRPHFSVIADLTDPKNPKFNSY